mmetsp:Transcript_3006/g.6972  ORF Transcript_3006/g.6972 Transcript_3006/m.6972 type:complete len:88 (+) Transcript_3006:384-647(+)
MHKMSQAVLAAAVWTWSTTALAAGRGSTTSSGHRRLDDQWVSASASAPRAAAEEPRSCYEVTQPLIEEPGRKTKTKESPLNSFDKSS